METCQGVSIGAGIGSITEILAAAQMICEKVIFRLLYFMHIVLHWLNLFPDDELIC